MASETLTFDVLARDSASRTFNQIGRSTEALETRFTRLSRAATGIASTLVGAQIGKSVLEAADKFELSRSRLETITKNIGASFEVLSKQVGVADDRMAKFGFTSADTEGALASLESVTRDPIKAFKDLALAADIARGRNIGLNEATLILQRVETGHVAQLAKLGIATKDAAGNTLTQAQALQMLSNLYGGAASRYAGTFAGKQAAVAAEMKNSAAEIGVALLPAAVDLAKVLQHDLLPPIEATAKFLDRNRAVIEPLAKAVLIAAAGWKAYTLATGAAAAVTKLMGGNAAATALALRAEAAAAATAGTSVSAGGAIGAAMAGGLGTGAAIASKALTAAKLAPAAGVGGISDLRPQQVPQGVQQLLDAQKAILASNPAALKDLQATFGQNPKLNVTQLAAWVAKWQQATAAIRTTAGAENVLGGALQRTATQLESHVQHALALRAAQDGLRSAMHAAAQAAADNGKALAGNSDAALANRDAVRNEVAQIFAVIDAMKQRGATDSAQANMLDVLTQAVEINAIKTYGDKAAVDALLTSLGLIPGRALAAANALAAINTAVAADKAISPSMVKAATASSQAASSAGKKIADSFTSGFTPVVAKGAEKAAKAVSNAMQKALDKVNSDLQSIRDAANSTQASVAGFADFATSGTDTLGASGTESDVRGQLRDKAAKLKAFATAFVRAAHMGVDPHLLAQFAQAGPDATEALNTIIHGGRAYVRQINATEQQIQSSAGAVARTEAASQNLGLIHRDLQTLPHKLERVFLTGLKNAGIYVEVKAIDKANGKRIVTR